MALDPPEDPFTGWGTQVGKYVDIPVVNSAVAGTSARTFTTGGNFAAMAGVVQENDIVVIEFGHNDGGGPTASSTGDCPGPGTTATCDVNGTVIFTFEKYIEDAVNSFKSKGAHVIVSSQTPDNPFNVSGTSEFVGFAQQAAQDTGVTYVDHFDLVDREFFALGETVVNGFYPVDHLHTNAQGADIIAQTFIRGVLCDKSNPLFQFVNNTTVVPATCS